MTYLPEIIIQDIVKAALAEDLGLGGDLTTMATIDPDHTSKYRFVSRTDGVLCGLDLARTAFKLVDGRLEFEPFFKDGDTIKKGDILAEVSGPTSGILSGERIALNFMGRLSGIASLTAKMVKAAQPYSPKIACSRKTMPLLRAVEKYAVRAGGGYPHRMRLDDCVMIKDNHIAANNGDIVKTLMRARDYVGHTVKIEVEVDTLEQFKAVLLCGLADIIMLDNMAPDDMRTAVDLNDGRCILEASGNVNLGTISNIAACGVDVISIGALTHSAPNFDIGLDAIDTAEDAKLLRLG